MKNKSKWTAALPAAVILLAGGIIFLWQTGFFAAASSLEGLQQYIERFSPYSQLIYFLVQLASVIVAPIPSNLTAAAGAVLFGFWEAFLLTAGAVLLGSVTVFLLARTLGQSFANRFVNQRVSEKYLCIIQSKRDIFLILVFLFPFFPDDLICILAGLTDIPLPRFFLIALFTRPWGLMVACAVGSSTLAIPLWGMVLLGLAGAALFLVGMKYGDKVEQRLLDKFKKDETLF
ncbi:MAG: TVP38/TMEM64 family protein [Oscillospiraceae bacterium]|nr:TVP38/TMEM64 family protein [Oscillospiraceae bacterium]